MAGHQPPDGGVSPSRTRFEIKPVTAESDVATLAHLADLSMQGDGFHEFHARFCHETLYEDCVKKVTASLRGDRTQNFLFKAVLSPSSAQAVETHDDGDRDGDSHRDEVIVGFTQWRLGYIDLPKVDPFAPKRGQSAAETMVDVGGTRGDEIPPTDAAAARNGKPRPFYAGPGQEMSRQLGNAYISTIRGKRHLYLHRLIVHPSYQRQGVGQALIAWGANLADRENVVAWLVARPAGMRLYERNGWSVVAVIDVDSPDPDLQVAPLCPMLRLPRTEGK